MKKALFAFLVVIMLFAFVGCKDEPVVVGAMKGFINTIDEVYNSGVLGAFAEGGNNYEIDLSTYDKEDHDSAVDDVLNSIMCFSVENYLDCSDFMVTEAKGTVVSTTSEDDTKMTNSLKAKNVSVTFKYKYQGEEHSKTFIFDGEISAESIGDTNDFTGEMRISNVKFNAKEYKTITFVFRVVNDEYSIISASCDGVDLKDCLNTLNEMEGLIGG